MSQEPKVKVRHLIGPKVSFDPVNYGVVMSGEKPAMSKTEARKRRASMEPVWPFKKITVRIKKENQDDCHI